MASDKKAILIFTECESAKIISSTLPSLHQLCEKGTVLNKVTCPSNLKAVAGAGNTSGETIWEATSKEGLIVGTLNEKYDLCVIDASNTIDELEKEITEVLKAADRSTLIALVAKGGIIYHGIGITKGKVIDTEYCVCTLAPTVAYHSNLPLPENSCTTIVFDIFKDRNMKFKEVRKLYAAVANMEAAAERQTRQPWDKHDCA